jgi:hypothetical protein
LVAESIAAFQATQKEFQANHFRRLDKFKYLLGICQGTIFKFLRIEITAKLDHCVRYGFAPLFDTFLYELDGGFDMSNKFGLDNVLTYLARYRAILGAHY